MVTLTIEIMAKRALQFPIAGFQLLDRLGQVLIADNTAVITQHQPFSAQPGQVFTAEFHYQIPLLPTGDYMLRAAVAEGESDGNAVMLHVVENALALHSVTAGSRHGLIGVPMKEMSLKLKVLDKEAC
jgi:lipopolysaccharide transport system ATP-binding protein